MPRSGAEAVGGRARAACWVSPFVAPVPAAVRTSLIRLQHERLHAMLPIICLVIAANAVAMSIAVLGDLPWWQQALPPALIVGTCLAVLSRRQRWTCTANVEAAHRRLRDALFVALALGAVAGIWCVNAFSEMEKYYCMTAPVFIGIAALVTASCLVSVPRAAIAGMTAAVAPIVVKMMMFPYPGIRAMAAMMVLITAMQAVLVLGRFRETVRMLVAQHDLTRLASSDALTGIDNRLAFMRALDDRIASAAPVLVAIADLNGFKAANDTYGHQAGDDILIGVARRMQAAAPSARSVARLGGDEFALLFDLPDLGDRIAAQLDAIRAAIAEPFAHGDASIAISTSLGIALSPADGTEAPELLRIADRRLYAEKRARPVTRAAA